jgi:formamidopyrimidine-DNA glycosylase
MAIELPEAHRLAQQMDAALKGKSVVHVRVPERAASLIRQGFINLHTTALEGVTVSGAQARGKWIFVALEPGWYLLLALETGGKILYHPEGAPGQTKAQVQIDFDDGSALAVHIVGWGFAKAVRRRDLDQETYPGRLGISPVDENFTPQALARLLHLAANQALKQALTDQRELAGIGNGYVQDILFRAGLHPKRKAGSLDNGEIHRLHDAIQTTLSLALAQGGRTGEVDLYGHPGGYEPVMNSAREGRPCPICAKPVERITVLGSASYVCPSCQR